MLEASHQLITFRLRSQYPSHHLNPYSTHLHRLHPARRPLHQRHPNLRYSKHFREERYQSRVRLAIHCGRGKRYLQRAVVNARHRAALSPGMDAQRHRAAIGHRSHKVAQPVSSACFIITTMPGCPIHRALASRDGWDVKN